MILRQEPDVEGFEVAGPRPHAPGNNSSGGSSDDSTASPRSPCKNSGFLSCTSSSQEVLAVSSGPDDLGEGVEHGSRIASDMHWRCHGCGIFFPERAALRDHVLERLIAHTTSDPTDLRARFDPEHHDRAALEQAASQSGTGSPLRCPVCGWYAADDSPGVGPWLDHVRDAPGGTLGAPGDAVAGQLAHRRLLTLVADLLVQDPPPAHRGCPGAPAWCPRGVARLVGLLAVPRADLEKECGDVGKSYRQLEEQVLGPPEEDIFCAAAGQDADEDAVFGPAPAPAHCR